MPDAETQTPDPGALVSHTDAKGRTLTGVGVTPDSLASVVDAAEDRQLDPAPVPSPSQNTADAPVHAPKQTRGQARFSELTEARKAAEAKAEAAEKRAAEIEARYSQPAVSQPPPVQAIDPSDPEPTEDDIGPKYSTYWEAQKAHQRWEIRQAERERRLEAQTRETHQRYEQSLEKAKQEYPDFDQAMALPHMQLPWIDEKKAIVRAHPDAARIQYALSQNPQLCEALRREESPVKFGMLLATAIPAAPVVVPASTGRPFVPPPAPIQPVGAGSKTAATAATDLADGHDFDSSGYREKRREERARFARGGR